MNVLLTWIGGSDLQAPLNKPEKEDYGPVLRLLLHPQHGQFDEIRLLNDVADSDVDLGAKYPPTEYAAWLEEQLAQRGKHPRIALHTSPVNYFNDYNGAYNFTRETLDHIRRDIERDHPHARFGLLLTPGYLPCQVAMLLAAETRFNKGSVDLFNTIHKQHVVQQRQADQSQREITPDDLVKKVTFPFSLRCDLWQPRLQGWPTDELPEGSPFQKIIGDSPQMRAAKWWANKASESPDASILLLGDTGTGKEVFARTIHEATLGRCDGPWVPVNVGGLDSLIDSKLFGHVKGAFTGASDNRDGALRKAQGGTLFLDEIGDLPLESQVKLLRVLQEREVAPVGSDQAVPVDFRLICATRRDLEAMVKERTFRDDLYYRIQTVTIPLPNLAGRVRDVEQLTEYFIRRIGKQASPQALKRLAEADWPGNVRELEHFVEKLAVFSGTSPTIAPETVEFCLADAGKGRSVHRPLSHLTSDEFLTELAALMEELLVRYQTPRRSLGWEISTDSKGTRQTLWDAVIAPLLVGRSLKLCGDNKEQAGRMYQNSKIDTSAGKADQQRLACYEAGIKPRLNETRIAERREAPQPRKDPRVSNNAWLAVVQLERIQSFLFDVPELKTMIGSNALVGEVLRGQLLREGASWRFTPLIGAGNDFLETEDNLPALARSCYAKFPDGDLLKSLGLPTHEENGEDPIQTNAADFDHPQAAYENGVLIRDAGNLHAVFSEETDAQGFLTKAQVVLQRHLPGVRYTLQLLKLAKNSQGEWEKEELSRDPAPEEELLRMQAVPDGPQLQICQASGQSPAHEIERTPEGENRYVSLATNRKREKGGEFDENKTVDILGLMRPVLLDRLKQATGRAVELTNKMKELAPSGHLAVIVADGNGIGQRSRDLKEQVKEQPGGKDVFRQYAAGEKFFHPMRRLVRSAVLNALVETFGPAIKNGDQQQGMLPCRPLMLGGDDLLLACDAAYAMEFLINYTRQLKDATRPLGEGQNKPLEIGAGVAIVKRDFPFHRAHALAEELAKSAKRLARQHESLGSTVDWLSCTESWHGDVADVRRRDALRAYRVKDRVEHLVLTAKPYPILTPDQTGDEGGHSLESLWEASRLGHSEESSSDKLAHTQLKGLAQKLPLGKRQAEQAVQSMPPRIRQQLTERGIFFANKEEDFPKPWRTLAEDANEAWYSTVFFDFLELCELHRLQLASQPDKPPLLPEELPSE